MLGTIVANGSGQYVRLSSLASPCYRGASPPGLPRFPISVNATSHVTAATIPPLRDRKIIRICLPGYRWYIFIDLYRGNNNWCKASVTG